MNQTAGNKKNKLVFVEIFSKLFLPITVSAAWRGQRPALSRFVPHQKCPIEKNGRATGQKWDKTGLFYFIDLVNNNLSFY